MKKRIETMRILCLPAFGTNFIVEYPNVESVKKIDYSPYIEIRFKGQATLTTIEFTDFNTTPFFDQNQAQLINLRKVETIAVRYEGDKSWHRRRFKL